jgi:hypothetical protein
MVPAGSLNQAIGGPGRWSSQGIVITKAHQLLNRLIHKPTSPIGKLLAVAWLHPPSRCTDSSYWLATCVGSESTTTAGMNIARSAA